MTNPIELHMPPMTAELAEQEKLLRESEKYYAESRKLGVEADIAHLDYRRKLNDRLFAEAADLEHRVYRFSGEIDMMSVGLAREHLNRWQRMYDPSHDLEIVLNSPGGSAYAGFELYDEILAARHNGHTVTVSARGLCASMAAIVLQAGTVRKVGPNTTLMIHKPSLHFEGDLDEMADVQQMLENITARMVDIFAERAASSGAAKPLSKTKIKGGMNRKDWFLTADEALEGGLVDVIG